MALNNIHLFNAFDLYLKLLHYQNKWRAFDLGEVKWHRDFRSTIKLLNLPIASKLN